MQVSAALIASGAPIDYIKENAREITTRKSFKARATVAKSEKEQKVDEFYIQTETFIAQS